MGYELLSERLSYTGLQSLRHHSMFLSPQQRSQLLLQSHRIHPYSGMVPPTAAAASAFAAASFLANYRFSLLQPQVSRPTALSIMPSTSPPPRTTSTPTTTEASTGVVVATSS